MEGENQNQENQNQPAVQPRDEDLQRQVNEMRARMEMMARQNLEMQNEMKRQAEQQEIDRQHWQDMLRQVQEEQTERHEKERELWRDRHLHGTASDGAARAIAKKSKSKIHMSTSSASSSHGLQKLTNRRRTFHALPDVLKEQLRETGHPKRETLSLKLKILSQAIRADQTTRALDSLSIDDDENNEASTSSSTSSNPLTMPTYAEQKELETAEVVAHECEKSSEENRMQQQLSSVFHVQNCASTQLDAQGNVTCSVPHCSVTRRILEHLRTCSFVTKCPIPMCHLTRNVLNHYGNCIEYDCQICQLANRESVSSRARLHRYINTLKKGLDEEALADMPSVSSTAVVPPALRRTKLVAGKLVSLNMQVPTCTFMPTCLPPASFATQNVLPSTSSQENSMEVIDSSDDDVFLD